MKTLKFDGRQYLDGTESDPVKLGWMKGAPPPEDKRITFESGTYFDFPQIRWSLSHMRELVATANVWRGTGAVSRLDRLDMSSEIDRLSFDDLYGVRRTFEDALFDTYTDGILILHRGKIIYERYFGALEPHLQHHCMSVSKSYVGVLASSLVHEGVLDENRQIPHYLPELQGTAWQDATLRQALDMQTGLQSLTAGPNTEDLAYSLAFGDRPRPSDYDGPQSLLDYLGTVRKHGVHGAAFAYKTVNTDILSWVMVRVCGQSLARILQDRLWAPLGCELDGYLLVDRAGTPMAGGGLCASLRDVARFGELMRREGDWNGAQLIPAEVSRELHEPGDPAKFAKGGYELLSGYTYRSMWWVSHNELDAFEARGMHGQRVYVAPRAEMVVARFASHPCKLSAANDPITLPQMLALGRMLRE